MKPNSSNSRQEAAKAAQAVMTAAAVMMASKQAGKNKNTVNQPDMRMAPLRNLKHPLKSGRHQLSKTKTSYLTKVLSVKFHFIVFIFFLIFYY